MCCLISPLHLRHLIEGFGCLEEERIVHLRIGRLHLLQNVDLRELGVLLNDRKSDLGRIFSRVEEGVGGGYIGAGVVGVLEKDTIVRIGSEPRPVGRRDGHSQGVALGEHERCVPQVEFDLVDLALLHVDRSLSRRFPHILAPSHSKRIVLDELSLSGGVNVRDLYGEVSVNGVGSDVECGEERPGHR